MYTKLQEEMKKQHITIHHLSKLIDVNNPDLYCAIKGTKPMFPKYKERIAEVLNCPIGDLFPEEEGDRKSDLRKTANNETPKRKEV